MATAAELSPLVTRKLEEVLHRFDGLQAILVCTSEGVPLLKAVLNDEEDELAYEYAETVFPTIFAGAAEQVGKLKFGAVKSATAFFENVVFVHANDLPLVLTLIASPDASIGALQALAKQLCPGLEPLKRCVEQAENH